MGESSLKFNISFMGRHWDFAKTSRVILSAFRVYIHGSRYQILAFSVRHLLSCRFHCFMSYAIYKIHVSYQNYKQYSYKCISSYLSPMALDERIRDEVGSRIESSLLSSSHPCQLCSDELWSSLRIKRISGTRLVLLVVVKV